MGQNLVGQKAYDQVRGLAYVQTRSAIENMFKRHNLTIIQDLQSDQNVNVSLSKGRYWLESCGAHTATNLGLVTGGITPAPNLNPGGIGDWQSRQPDKLMLYFNDERDEAELTAVRDIGDDTMNNEVPQYYPLAMSRVFGTKATFRQSAPDPNVLKGWLQQGFGIQICLKNPGHYIGIYDFDDASNSFVFVDPWPERIADGIWWAAKLSLDELANNVNPFFVTHEGLIQ